MKVIIRPLFTICQHGWLNIQALQINLSYRNNEDLTTVYNRLRPLLPYLIAVTASSPMVEGHLTGMADNRLIYYRENQKEIPGICDRLIPEKSGQLMIIIHARKRSMQNFVCRGQIFSAKNG